MLTYYLDAVYFNQSFSKKVQEPKCFLQRLEMDSVGKTNGSRV